MKANKLTRTLIFAAALGLPLCAFAKGHHKKEMVISDEQFAKEAAIGGLTEVALGQVAQQNASSQEVKDFGTKMVADHGKANDNLKALASKNSMMIPDKPDAAHQAMIDKLTKETGPAFDKAYSRMMVKDHREDRALFASAIDNVKNPDLKQFASETLSVVKEHLGMIEEINGKLNGETAGGKKHMKHKMASSMDEPGGSGAGNPGSGKSGLAPGSNANPMASPAPGTTEGAGAPPSDPATSSNAGAGQGKSGAAPGGNANPGTPTGGQ